VTAAAQAKGEEEEEEEDEMWVAVIGRGRRAAGVWGSVRWNVLAGCCGRSNALHDEKKALPQAAGCDESAQILQQWYASTCTRPVAFADVLAFVCHLPFAWHLCAFLSSAIIFRIVI
jgi:hypothetical protein